MGDIFDQVAAHSSSNGAAPPPPPAHGDIFDQVASGNVVTKSPSDYAPDLAAEAARGAARLKQRTLGSMEHRDDVPLYSSSPYLLDNPDAAKPVMVNPHQDQGFFGQPITGTQSVVDGSSQIANAHSGADLAGGASKVIRGAGSVVAPVALPLAIATAPIPTIAALGTGTLAQKGTEAALDGRVAPEYRDLAGDAAGLVAGGLAGHGAGEVIDTIDTLRNLPGAGPGIPGKIADVVGSAAGSLPGSLDGVRNKAADVLNASAKQNIETALNPTTKINKKLTRDQVAQGLVDRRVTATSLKHLEEKAGAKADELGQQIDDAFDAHAEAGTKLDPEPILAALQEEKESYIVDGVVIDKSYVDKIHDLQEQLKDVAKANGGEVPVASLRRIRQIHDKAIAGSKGGFALAPADASIVAALKTYADAIRGSIADADPKLAKLNQEYSFWRNAEKVAGDSADRKTGQRPALTQTILENGGMVAGAALGGGTGAIVGRWLGKATGKLANSTLWNTLSASAKGRIADLLATGDEAGANRVARDPNNHSITPAGATATLAGGAAGTAQSAGGNGSSGPAAAPVSPGGSAVIPANGGRGAAQGGATGEALPGSGGAEADAFPGVRITGKSAVVALPDGSGLKVRYEIRDGRTVNATHSPVTFSPNAKSRVRATQPRDYEDPLNHGVVVERATPAAYNANYSLASDAPSAADGPPIAYDQLDEGKPNGRADALAGNERHMVNLRMQKMYPEVFDRTYGAGLRERLGAYGMDPKADLSGIQNPHVFRVVEGRLSPEEMQRVMADTNKSVTKSATASEQMISDSRRVSPATLNDLAGKVESFGPDATLAQALEGTPGGEVVQRLIDDGVIAKAERGKYIDSDGKITKEGKLRVSGLAIGRFFTDPEQLKEVQPSVRTKLERMAAPLVKVENDPDWSLTPRVSAALDLIHRARMRGMDNLGDFVKQDGLFSSEKYSPEVIHMAELLRAKGGSKELTAGARLYAEDASFAGGGASLLGDTPTPKSSFEQHFGKPADASQNVNAAQIATAAKGVVVTPHSLGRGIESKLYDKGDASLQVVTRDDGYRSVSDVLVPQADQGKGIGQSLYLRALQDGPLLHEKEVGDNLTPAAARARQALVDKGLARVVTDERGRKLLVAADSAAPQSAKASKPAAAAVAEKAQQGGGAPAAKPAAAAPSKQAVPKPEHSGGTQLPAQSAAVEKALSDLSKEHVDPRSVGMNADSVTRGKMQKGVAISQSFERKAAAAKAAALALPDLSAAERGVIERLGDGGKHTVTSLLNKTGPYGRDLGAIPGAQEALASLKARGLVVDAKQGQNANMLRLHLDPSTNKSLGDLGK